MPVTAVGVAAPMGAMTVPMSAVMIAAVHVDVRAVMAVDVGAVMDVSAMMRGVMSATVMAAAMRGVMPATTMTTAVMVAPVAAMTTATMTTAVAAMRHRAP